MSLSAIRTALKNLVAGVTGIDASNVHDYDRLAKDWDEYLGHYKHPVTGVINTWIVTRESTQEALVAAASKADMNHLFVIKGFYSVGKDDDATEKTFEDLVEAIRTALRAEQKTDQVLGGTAYNITSPQLRVSVQQKFGAVWCHHAQITVSVKERVST